MTFPLSLSFADELAPKPVTVFSVGGFPINSSMIVAFAAAALVIIGVQIAMRAPKLIPSGAQNFVEWVVELLSDRLEQNLGHRMMDRSFWFFGTTFVFIFGCNLVSLLPGVGSFGAGHVVNGAFEVTRPYLRGANADVNMTAAMSAIFFLLWFYWSFSTLGFWGFFTHLFGSKVKFDNPFARAAFGLVFFAVGIVEVVSIVLIRPLAFTFRLYGNIFGGEYLLDSIYRMAPHFAFLLLVPFYFLELLVAFIQALVFCILTAVFTGLMCNTGDHPEDQPAH